MSSKKNEPVVSMTGDEMYEKLWPLIKQGAVVNVEYTLGGPGRILTTTTVMDGRGVTVDQRYVEMTS